MIQVEAAMCQNPDNGLGAYTTDPDNFGFTAAVFDVKTHLRKLVGVMNQALEDTHSDPDLDGRDLVVKLELARHALKLASGILPTITGLHIPSEMPSRLQGSMLEATIAHTGPSIAYIQPPNGALLVDREIPRTTANQFPPNSNDQLIRSIGSYILPNETVIALVNGDTSNLKPAKVGSLLRSGVSTHEMAQQLAHFGGARSTVVARVSSISR